LPKQNKQKAQQRKLFEKDLINNSEVYFKGAGENDKYIVVTLNEKRSRYPMIIYTEGRFCRSEAEAKRVTQDYEEKGLIALYLQRV